MPPDASTVTLVAVSSASIEVKALRLRTSAGRLDLLGIVAFLPAPSTASEQRRVNIVFLDSIGRRLRVETAPVAIHNLSNGSRPSRSRGDFSLAIPEMPVGTEKIEVRHHESAHEPPRPVASRYLR